jgi:NAD(P)-dependent dehydrogenase (short-subunit alcohol dehydrogenase family)
MNIVVTGAGRGIGAEVVKILCKHKANQIIATSRSGENLRKLQSECLKINPDLKLTTIEFDLTQYDFLPFLVQKIELAFHHCDILLNNAGRLVNKPFTRTDFTDFDDTFNVNVKSLFFLTQFLLPLMGSGGHIVNISSMGGIQGARKFAGLTAYSASKGAVAILTEALAEELKEREISINCLALGSVQTEMFEKAFPGHKALLSPQQMAQFIADFAITGNRYFNGKVIPVSQVVI